MNLTIWEAMAELEKAIDRCRKIVMRRFGLSAVEVDVLFFLANSPQHTTAAEIEECTKLKKSHISLAVSKLLGKGYLTRNADENDRKRLHLRLTASANAIVSFAHEQIDRMSHELFRGFSSEERQFFSALCSRIITNFRGKPDLGTASRR